MRNPVLAFGLVLVLAIQLLGVFSAATEKFKTNSLISENEFRKKHGVPDLKLDASLSSFAQEWANQLAAENKMYHRPNNKYGENIFWVSGGNPAAATATKVWYDEIKKYNFDKAEFSHETGHFTQLVWRGSQRVGIGSAKSKTGGTYVVANYDPPGNVIGAFKENVPRPL